MSGGILKFEVFPEVDGFVITSTVEFPSGTPPVVTHRDESGLVWADFELGAAYEGPPGHVHGGVSALILDHLLGEAASPDRKPRFTGSITVRYLRATRLGRLHAEAIRTRADGVKVFCAGTIRDDDGITVEAEGVFITPRWLRE